MNRRKGFSLIEILLALFILGVLLTIAVYSFKGAEKEKELDIAVQTLAVRLEEAKGNAVSGKFGQKFGIKFDVTSYTFFSGDVFDPANTENRVVDLPVGFEITEDIPSADNTIIFSRLIGTPSATGTVTITNTSDPTLTAGVAVGELGDVTVIE